MTSTPVGTYVIVYIYIPYIIYIYIYPMYTHMYIIYINEGARPPRRVGRV